MVSQRLAGMAGERLKDLLGEGVANLYPGYLPW